MSLLSQNLGPLFPNLQLTLVLFHNVTNSSDFYDYIKAYEKQKKGSLLSLEDFKEPFHVYLNPHRIFSLNHISLAVVKGFYRQKHGFMRSKTLNTEVVSCLSISSQLSECFDVFGFQKDSSEILAVIVTPTNKEVLDIVFQLSQPIKGEQVPVTEFLGKETYFDKETLLQHLNIQEEELDLSGGLESALACRLALKHI